MRMLAFGKLGVSRCGGSSMANKLRSYL